MAALPEHSFPLTHRLPCVDASGNLPEGMQTWQCYSNHSCHLTECSPTTGLSLFSQRMAAVVPRGWHFSSVFSRHALLCSFGNNVYVLLKRKDVACCKSLLLSKCGERQPWTLGACFLLLFSGHTTCIGDVTGLSLSQCWLGTSCEQLRSAIGETF